MSENKCFHCGLEIQEKSPSTAYVFDQKQSFCCHGCKAVCESIVASGQADFYRFRDKKSQPIDLQKIHELTNQLGVYDKPEIQQDFVRLVGSNKSAWVILEGIQCSACMWLNERTLQQLDGVISLQMDYAGQQANIVWDDSKIQLSSILKAISNIGYIAHPFDPSQREALDKEKQQRSVKRLIFAVMLGMIVMQTAFSYYFFTDLDESGAFPLWIEISRWVNLFICAALMAYPGQLFFINAWRDLKNKTVGMDVPVALGLSLAWVGSFMSTVTHNGHVYFESIAMFVVFLLFARHIELKARIKANNLLDSLAKIVPKMALKIEGDNLKQVPVVELIEGDFIRIKTGEIVPVDGYLRSQQSSFDESILTGESKPIIHNESDFISGGVTNIDQPVTLEVKHREIESTLNNISQLARKSTQFKPQYVDLADRVASYFVMAILVIATSTYGVWLWLDPDVALDHTIAVLIVTCPCALSLASPVAMSMSAAAMTRLHMLMTKMSIIEKFNRIDTIVFDKTGTLTQAKPELRQTLSLSGMDDKKLLQIAASLEIESIHPFAKALVKANKEQIITINKRHQYPSQGIKGVYNNQTWILGKKSFTQSKLSMVQQKETDAWLQQGHSAVYLSNEDGGQAVFFIEDPLRKGAAELINNLKQYEISILSGDDKRTVHALAKKLNVDYAEGALSADEKLLWIKNKQANGKKVLMFGDGINDVPTLAAADLSASFSEASDLAQSYSDLLFLNSDYSQTLKVFELMRKTRRIIKQNLGWAILYNMTAVPAAALGWVTPWMAAIGMSVSSLIVVLNSMRLKKEIV